MGADRVGRGALKLPERQEVLRRAWHRPDKEAEGARSAPADGWTRSLKTRQRR